MGWVAADRGAPLTRREREVATLIVAGWSNAEIAESLTIAHETVKCHVSAILAKSGAADRTEFAAAWLASGEITIDDVRHLLRVEPYSGLSADNSPVEDA